jgi:hypothetical protein
LGDAGQLAENKFLIQMQSWKHSVESARASGRALEGSYSEIRYERLCQDPIGEASRLLQSFGLVLSRSATQYLSGEISTDGIGRWRRYPFTPAERRDFANACEHGKALLSELGYDDR